MKRKSIILTVMYLTSALLYVAAIVTFSSGDHNGVGAIFMSLASMFLILASSRRSAENSSAKNDDKKDDKKDDENNGKSE